MHCPCSRIAILCFSSQASTVSSRPCRSRCTASASRLLRSPSCKASATSASFLLRLSRNAASSVRKASNSAFTSPLLARNRSTSARSSAARPLSASMLWRSSTISTSLAANSLSRAAITPFHNLVLLRCSCSRSSASRNRSCDLAASCASSALTPEGAGRKSCDLASVESSRPRRGRAAPAVRNSCTSSVARARSAANLDLASSRSAAFVLASSASASRARRAASSSPTMRFRSPWRPSAKASCSRSNRSSLRYAASKWAFTLAHASVSSVARVWRSMASCALAAFSANRRALLHSASADLARSNLSCDSMRAISRFAWPRLASISTAKFCSWPRWSSSA
mmetsp:Transcript_5586/g.16172  ORF Transcript_5586/g.16172 Transcript_5586/m.16172 type:complete len:340 (+) Transcript_5586:1336-2355(+)